MSAPGLRLRAMAVLTGGAVVVGLTARGLARVVDGPPTPPWSLPAWLRSDEMRSGSNLRPLLFVTPGCRWCADELAMWRGLAPKPRVLVLQTVAAPTSHPRIAPELARHLGIRRVPTTLWLDRHDTVRAVVVGRTPPRRLQQLRELHAPAEVVR